MHFSRHSEVEGRHAFLSPSQYHRFHYDDDKLVRVFVTNEAARRGSILHDFAASCIRLKQKLQETEQTLNRYVNDAIGYRMTPEQVLYVSDNAFGTADAICFRNNKLRIHDLKTGASDSSIHQLEIYAAFFCIEYRFDPLKIEIELRIYQNDKVEIFDADPDVIMHYIDRTITGDRIVNEMRMEDLT